MYEKIESILMDYCNSGEVDYAYMLDGKWGKGKTYFIREYFIPKIKESDPEKNIVYISLNGLESVDRIKDKFVTEQILKKQDIHDNKAVKFLGKGINILKGVESFGIGKLGEDIQKVFTHGLEGFTLDGCILILDDLERVSKKVSYEEVFGYILDNFVEAGIKIIIVGNDEKVKSDEYGEIKEKLFRRVVKFTPDMKKLIGEFLEKKLEKIGDSDYREAIESKKEELISLICSLKAENLRTLDFFIDVFYKIYKCEVEEVKETRGNLFYNTLIMSIEFKNGGLTKANIDSLKKLQTSISLGFMKEPKDYLKEFKKRYEKYRFVYIESIIEFVKDGFLDEEKLKKEIERIYPSIDVNPIRKLINEIQEKYSFYEEEELESKMNELMEKLEESKVELYKDLIDSYDLINYSIDMSHIISLDKETLERKILERANKFLEEYTQEEYKIFSDTMSSVWGEQNEFKKKLKDLLDKKTRECNERFQKEVIYNFFNEINSNKYSYYSDEEGLGNGIFGYNLIEKIIEYNLEEEVKRLNNCGLYYFNSLLRREYLEISNAGEFRVNDVPHLEKIKILFKDQFEKDKGRLRRVRIQETIEKIGETIQHIENTKVS
ncbi:hypothetical protein PM10SUCC1_37200 [Propionigenium maris DSM 9537]|uniref:KAP family P-loop domain-containing protein n=1 Tax=Propionigenium maris DSM 9537 TaxID=1123000 RepID=A0A9W6GQB2_9FUSO|nr:hypothetical protein [Propionigenium maris]GLI58206.1 hypothetical protein PM10SUCC1_37200 [Propionigenium maris DSM 9537]